MGDGEKEVGDGGGQKKMGVGNGRKKEVNILQRGFIPTPNPGIEKSQGSWI